MRGLGLLLGAMLLWGCQREPEPPVAVSAPAAPAQPDTARAKAGPQTASARYAESSVEIELKQLSEHVYFVQGAAGAATDNQGFISNAGVIITNDGVVVLDSLGTPSLGQKLLDLIRAKTDKPIRYAIVTHYHADHIYGLQVFADAGATVVGPRGAELYLNGANAATRLDERRNSLAPWVDERTRLVAPQEYIDGPREIKVGDVTLRLEHLGAAHSEGDLSLYVMPDKVLFTGDLIFEGRVPFVGDADTRQWLETLQRIEQSQPVALVPGHGPAARDPLASVRLTRDYLGFLREQMGRAAAEFIPFDTAYDTVDWTRFRSLPAFAEANRRNAYQVFLALEAEGMPGK